MPADGTYDPIKVYGIRTNEPNLPELTPEQWTSLEILMGHESRYPDIPMFIADFTQAYAQRRKDFGSRKTLIALKDYGLVDSKELTKGLWTYWKITPRGRSALEQRTKK